MKVQHDSLSKKVDYIKSKKNTPTKRTIKSFSIHRLKKNNSKKKKLKFLVNSLLICIICCSLAVVGYHQYSNYRTKQLYSALANQVANIRNQVAYDHLKSADENSNILPQYQKAYQQNSDLIGWIRIDGTNVNFPVMYTQKIDYYARRNFNKQFTDYGSIWLDEANTLTADTRDNNLLIYGHNMWREHAMFSLIHGYEEESYYNAHPTIHFDSIYEEGIYDVIAAVRTEVLMSNEKGFRYYYFRGYHTQKEFDEYMNFLSEKKLYDTGIPVKYGDELITLSTCSRHTSDKKGRFIVVAKRRK